MLLLPLFLSFLCSAVVNASLQIVSGGSWTSPTTGEHIQAHGAGVIKVDETWYMVGENHTSGSAFQSVNCYSSTNLVEWDFVGELLSVGSSGDLGPNRVVERPKVIFNENTNQYVLWMHIDDSSYAEAKVGVATSTSVCGKYTYHGSWQPLGFQSRDMGLFKDDDGTAYLLTEDRANGLRIDKLTDDYLNVTEATFLFQDMEAPAMAKIDGTYFMFASHLTGWDANDNEYTTATSLTGPWSDWATFAPVGSDTYTSQTNFILDVGDFYMYMGDRWVSDNLMRSTYIWQPLTISGTKASLPSSFLSNWVVNAAASTWSTAPSNNAYEAESSSNTLSSGAETLSCSGCSGSKAVGELGGSSDGTLKFNGLSSSATTRSTLQLYYANGDSTQRFATVSVNGASQTIAFIPTNNGQAVNVASIDAQLNSGSSNTLTISGISGGWAPDVDRLLVPSS